MTSTTRARPLAFGLSLLGATALLASACAPAPAAQAPTAPAAAAPTTAAKPAAGAPAPTAAAAKPAPAPTAAPAPATKAGAPRMGGTFTFGQSGDASALDPWNVTDGNSLQVTRQIFESLVDYEPQGYKVVPKLATRWEKSADGTQWTFTLRDGVKFHDGTPFNADAVVFNFERARNTKSEFRRDIGSKFAYYEDVWGGFDDNSRIVSVTAKDPMTVVFTTKTPLGPFLQNMAMPTFAIVSPQSIKADPAGFPLPANTRGPAGTGPFKFASWQKDDRITLEKNPDYWNTDDQGNKLPYLDRVVVRSIKDTSARVAELKAGSVQAIKDFSPNDMPPIKADPNLQIIPRPSFNIAYLGMNQAQKPFDNINVRKAIAYGINKQAIADTIYAGTARPATQFLVPGMLGYDESLKSYPYDIEKARTALKDAGLPTPVAIDLWYMPVSRPYYPDPKQTAEAFASDLNKVGFQVSLQTEDWSAYLTNVREGKKGIWLLGWTGDNGDPDNFLYVFFRPKLEGGKAVPTVENAWNSPELWDLLTKAQTETDPARRADMYKQASAIIERDVPRIPMFHADPPTGASKKLQGFLPHPTGGEAFTRLWLSQ